MKLSRMNLPRRKFLAGTAGGIAALRTSWPVLAQQSTAATGAPVAYEDLAARLAGELITPGDAAYDHSRVLWNGMIDRYPAGIARCTGSADVIEVVNYARERGIPATVRGGGHNVAGKSLRDGALAIDLAPMHGVRVDPQARRARVGGGARWGAVDRETVAQGLVTPGGTVSTTGVAGLTLGGGLGWLMRKYGLACDNVVSADVVTVDGRLLVTSAEHNPDLFWAIRGGGGNFGVVTSFEFQLHDLQPVTGGIALYPGKMLRDLLEFYRDYTASAPDSVTAQAGAMIGPEGTPLAGTIAGWMGVCHIGPEAEGERLVKPIKDFGPPAVDLIRPVAYTTLQTMFDAGMAAGQRNYWRSSFLPEISDKAIDTMVARADELPRPGSLMFLEHLGGEIARVGEHETAFASRGARYNLSVLSMWRDAADDDEYIAWTREVGDEFRSYSTGGAYVNYMAGDMTSDQVRAMYEANFERLVEVKRKYDPDNFFSANQNIAP